MFPRSKLILALEKAEKSNWADTDVLYAASDEPVRTRREAQKICNSLRSLDKEKIFDDVLSSPLYALTAYFQQVEAEEAYEIMKGEGIPLLREFAENALKEAPIQENNVMFILKILSLYKQPEDTEIIRRFVRNSFNIDDYWWSVILTNFDKDHPFAQKLAHDLHTPLPKGFLLVAYLVLFR